LRFFGVKISIDLVADNCPNVTVLNATNNLLTDLNVANGNNTNFTTFSALGNPGLTCVFVDDTTYANANSPFMGSIDTTATFVETQVECDAALSIEQFEITDISVYPNPFNSGLFIDGLHLSTTMTTIYDIYGKEVLKTANTSINTDKLSSGVYIIKVETETGIISKKMIKQ